MAKLDEHFMEPFLEKFVAFFKSREFQFYTSDIDPTDVKRASLFARLLVSGFSSASFGVIGLLTSGEGKNSTNDQLKSCLAEFSKYGELVGIYLKYGQPVILLVVNGDELNDEEFLGRYILIHQTATKMRGFSFRIVPGGKLPVRCLVFTVFSKHNKALHFKDDLASKCKKFNLFNKVWALPWTVDLERKRVSKYGGLPLTEFKEEMLERAFFD